LSAALILYYYFAEILGMMHMTCIMLERAIRFTRSVKHDCREWRETVDRYREGRAKMANGLRDVEGFRVAGARARRSKLGLCRRCSRFI
jgi:hypothetical protein